MQAFFSSLLSHISAAPWISFPRFASFGWSLDMALLLPFLIATLCSSLKDIGDLTTCQKINDSEWKRSDMQSIGNRPRDHLLSQAMQPHDFPWRQLTFKGHDG